MGNFNMPDINAKMQQMQNNLQQLQEQARQFQQYQQQQQQPPAAGTPTSMPAPTQQPAGSTYPKVFRTDTVEDILNNPQWKQELVGEFNESEAGQRAKNQMELIFMEFCEKQTGKSSTMLTNLRNSQPPRPKAAAKKTEEPTSNN